MAEWAHGRTESVGFTGLAAAGGAAQSSQSSWASSQSRASYVQAERGPLGRIRHLSTDGQMMAATGAFRMDYGRRRSSPTRRKRPQQEELPVRKEISCSSLN